MMIKNFEEAALDVCAVIPPLVSFEEVHLLVSKWLLDKITS